MSHTPVSQVGCVINPSRETATHPYTYTIHTRASPPSRDFHTKVPLGVDPAGDPPVLHRVGQRERAVLTRDSHRRHARAKGISATLPFGTRRDLYKVCVRRA